MSGVDRRSLVLVAVVFAAMLGVGATAATAVPAGETTVTADRTVGPDAMANETTVNTTFVGTVADEGTVTVEASGVTSGGAPADGAEVTVTVGGEAVTTAPVTNGTLEATFDPSDLDLEPTDSAAVGLAGYTVEDPATVEVVHEAFDLGAGQTLRSVPQGAQLTAEDVAAVTVWNGAAGRYEAVTDPVFETASNLHRGLYITATGDARLGYTFDTAATDPGTVGLSSGWNYVGSNFDISATANLTVAEDLALTAGNISDLEIFSADFGRSLDPGDTVGAYDSYWVFVEEGDQPVERSISDPAYNRSAREDVLGVSGVTFDGQALGASATDAPAVLTEGVSAQPGDAVAVTYTDGSDEIVAGLTVLDDGASDESVSVEIADTGGFPGEHTAHVVTDRSDETAVGEPLSNATAESIVAQDSAVVFNATVTIGNQTYLNGTTTVQVNASSLDPDQEYVLVVHEAGEGLPVLGSSDSLTGQQENVTVPLESALVSRTDVVAMMHFADSESAFGAPITAFDPVADGLVPVTDRATVDVGPTGTVNGTVTASGDTASADQTAGEPLAGVSLTLYAGTSTDPADAVAETTTDENGTYAFPALSTGEYTVEASAADFASGSTSLTVVPDTTETVDFALDYAEAGAISGEIALDVADPDEDVTVTVDVAETADSTTVTLAGSADTATYTIPDVDVNVGDGYTVTATSDSTNYDDPADIGTVQVGVGETVEQNVTFERQTGTLDGTVTDSTDAPVEGATVEVFGFGSGGPPVASADTGPEGGYTIPAVPVGEHFLTVSVDGSEAANTSATISQDQTTTADFVLGVANFAVEIADNATSVAGGTQRFNVTVENTGSLADTQTLTLEWGDGVYTDSTVVDLAGGEDRVVEFSIPTDGTQPLGTYSVTVTSEDDTDGATATVGPERSLDRTTVAPGGTVTVTVSGQVGESANVSFADTWSPAADNSAIVNTSYLTEIEFAGPQDVVAASSGAVAPGTVEVVYEIYVPDSATDGTVYEWEPAQDGDGSLLSLGDDPLGILGAGSFQVETTATVDEVVLDSVSSLLDANGDVLTDDSLTPLRAEPTASNNDSDGNGDAVSYPSDTDIPVVAVDGGVVGITGPFVTTNTDFASYGNEEFVLNLYDSLLGGSGTILHDEGHGQFYTLAPNGGDDFQAFADYAAANGYTYDNTTDIVSDTDTADAFVITSPPQAFTQSELDALSTFVDNGGVVFLHDQSDFDNFDETANHNEIASALGAGFRFNDDQVVDDTNNAGASFVPETGNFNTAGFGSLFADREGLGLDVNETYEVDVVSVADGDTADVELADGTVETVRIVGLDTPETGSTSERLQEYEGIDDGPALKQKGDGATAYAKDRLENETVNLSFDPNEGLRGNFGRLLGFLELPDGDVYNEAVIRDGWARVYDSGFDRHDQYLDFEQQARSNNSGIWDISDPAATPERGDGPVEALFFPQPVAVTGPEIPVASESGESLVALDTAANVAAIGGPLIEERFEAGEGGPGIDGYGVYPFLTNVIDAVGTASGPVVVDGGHGQFAADFAVSAEDTAYYMRYLEGQSPGSEPFIGLDGVVNLTSEAGPDLVENGTPSARAVVISTPTTALSPAEQSAVAAFADAGGAVILLGSAADTTALSNFDPLLSALDTSVGFTETSVTDPTNNLGGDSSVPTTSNFAEGAFPGLFTPYTGGQTTVPFVVSGLTPAEATVAEGAAFDVSATVTNNGSASDEQTIELRLEPDGPSVRTRTVQLGPAESTTVTFENLSVDQTGTYNHTVASATDQVTGTLTVEQALDDVVLDSVSSLLDANGGVLTDDSLTPLRAEPTASNNDSDGNGDAVSYPSDTDIPVMAVDDGVVGVTGPFVTTDTDFANFSNEEVMLNLYDALLGGSGTILHDEGHGQYYTLAPNGGDDFQAFADYAAANGYTYDSTTDIEGDIDTADAFVITSPEQAFTQSELDALSSFVADGGVVFLHDQSDFDNFDETANHNEIASALGAGFRFNDDQVIDDTNNAGVSFVPTTGNFNEAEYPSLFAPRDDAGLPTEPTLWSSARVSPR